MCFFEELPEEERQQEMEALKEEQDADDVDGEEGKKAGDRSLVHCLYVRTFCCQLMGFPC